MAMDPVVMSDHGCVGPSEARVVHLANELMRHRHLLRSAEAFRRGRFVPRLFVCQNLRPETQRDFLLGS